VVGKERDFIPLYSSLNIYKNFFSSSPNTEPIPFPTASTPTLAIGEIPFEEELS
jgi:hypothetical protein